MGHENKFLSTEDLDIHVQLPDYHTYSLPNGATIYIMPVREMPLTNMLMLYAHGSADDPIKYPGLAHTTCAMLCKGTRNKSASDIDFYADHLGMLFNSNAYNQYSGIEAEVLVEYVLKAWDLMFEIMTDPAFPEEEIEKHKNRKKDAIKKLTEDPAQLVGIGLMQLMFNREFLGKPTIGTPESISRITRRNILEFYQEFYYPAAATLFMVGDFSNHQVKQIEADLSSLNPQKNYQKTSVGKFNNQFKIWIIDKPESSQVQVKIGWHTVAHHHPDFYPLLLGTIILGGGFSSRLMQAIRVNKGLSYGAYAQLQPIHPDGSILALQSFTRAENIDKLLSSFQEEISKMKETEIASAECKTHRNYISGQYPLSFETTSDLLTKLTKLKTLGYTRSQIETLPQLLKKITTSEIKRTLGRHIHWEEASIAMVGSAKDIIKNLPAAYNNRYIVKSADDILHLT